MDIHRSLKKQASFKFLSQNAFSLAPQLLGCIFETPRYYTIITEVEAYDASKGDKACHAYPKVTSRSKSLARSAGHIYVYMIYGINYCVNIVADQENIAAGCLLRSGKVFSKDNLSMIQDINGPARLTKFLSITKEYDGVKLGADFKLWKANSPVKYQTSPRIGISQCKDWPWRFFISN